MQKKIFTTVLVLFTVLFTFSISVFANSVAENLARQAISDDSKESQSAIKALRQMNQKGLDAMFKVYGEEIRLYKKTGNKTPTWKKVSEAIDSVAMQKDAYSSRLFWNTDFEKAKAEAKTSNKPILSLRLLGNLNEEYSCANSRFFRSILYSNAEISKYLRENYVLHWKSVRPAPKITIDFGDGRKLVRTITGNSIHYVLDKDGKIVEALPGLYNPKVFSDYLKIANRRMDETALINYRRIRRNYLLTRWKNDLQKSGIDFPKINSPLPIRRVAPTPTKTVQPKENNSQKKPSALKAAPIAVTKSAVEMPTVRAISHNTEALAELTKFEEWKKLAKLFGTTTFDKQSIAFINLKTASNEKDFENMIENLKKYVSIDTVQNEYLLHTKIYEWLNRNADANIEKFNEKVYAELFLTPKSDKWLGLHSDDIYSALEGNGVIK